MDYSKFEWYRGSVPWLRERTIFLTKHGSHAYGTNIPGSDLDLKGIAIPPKEYYLGNLNRFEQAENKGGLDVVIYGLNKFVQLASDCNPNIIEVLFTDENDWIIPDPRRESWRFGGWHSAWGKLFENRKLFLSQRAKHTFSGYAVSQLNRIKSHRNWLLNPVKSQPQRSDFGLPQNDPTIGKDQLSVIDARIRKLEDVFAGAGWTKDRVAEQDAYLVEKVVVEHDLNRAIIPIVIAERKYAAAMRNWSAYQKWKTERNPDRAVMEARYGYDVKHAMHLVRLLLMVDEILSTGRVIVKRPDAEMLLSIRAGAVKYDDIIQFATWKEASLELIQSPLPHEPDRKAIDRLLINIVEEANHP